MAPATVHLPADARRIVVRGASASGKTTLARSISRARGIPHVELDGIYHQAGWTPLADDSFRASIAGFMDDESWVVCGNYRKVTDPLLARADTIVLFDLPRRTVMARVLRRSIHRAARRKELWNGNKEQFSELFRTDPEVSIIAWAWTKHAGYHIQVAAFLADPPRSDLRIVHVTSAAQLRRLRARLGSARATTVDVQTATIEGSERDGS